MYKYCLKHSYCFLGYHFLIQSWIQKLSKFLICCTSTRRYFDLYSSHTGHFLSIFQNRGLDMQDLEKFETIQHMAI